MPILNCIRAVTLQQTEEKGITEGEDGGGKEWHGADAPQTNQD